MIPQSIIDKFELKQVRAKIPNAQMDHQIMTSELFKFENYFMDCDSEGNILKDGFINVEFRYKRFETGHLQNSISSIFSTDFLLDANFENYTLAEVFKMLMFQSL